MSSENPTKTEVGMQEASTQKAMEEQVVIEKAAFKQVTDGVEQAKKVQTLGNTAQAADTQAANNDLKKLDTVFPETKRDGYSAQNANDNAVAAVEATIAKDAGKPGAQPQDIKNSLDKVFSSLPKGLKDFFSKIFDIFTDLAKANTDKLAQTETAKLDSPENKKIFDKYGVKTDKNVLDFGKGPEIKGERKTNGTTVGSDLPKENTKDNKITIDPNTTKSVTTKEEDGKVTVTVTDNNNASNIYTISGLKAIPFVKTTDGENTNIATRDTFEKPRGVEV